MKSKYVSDLRPNEDVTTTFLVQSKDVRLKKTGEPYLSLMLADKTGEIDAKMWDNVAEVVDTFDRDDFIKVKGRVQIYQNRPQFTIHKMVRCDEGLVDFADYFPASERDPEEMFAELRDIVAQVKNEHIRALLEAVLDDPEIAARYKRAPAAKSVHHAYLGGLLEHVLSLCYLCRVTAQHYPFIDLDLMIAGAVLHDVGKIYELSYRRSFGYTDQGQLLGHIIIGLRIIDDKLRQLPEFPPRLRALIEHIVLSHHGSLEFGSPKVPVFPEALLFHYLDNIDSKMENMRAVLERDNQVEGVWTSYSPPLERYILKKEKFLGGGGDFGDGPAPGEETAPPADAAAADEQALGRPKPAPLSQSAAVRRGQGSLFGDKLRQALNSDE